MVLLAALESALAEPALASLLEQSRPTEGGAGGTHGEQDIMQRGVAVGLLRALTDSFGWAALPTWRVVADYITPLTSAARCRFVELDQIRPFTGSAHSFVSHAWSSNWGDLVAAVSDGSDPSRRVWLDVFAVLQHPQTGQEDDLRALQRVLRGTPHGTLLVWNPESPEPDANPMARAWCLYEINTTVRGDRPLIVKMGRRGTNADGDARRTSTTGAHVFAPLADADAVTRLTYATDVSKARAKFEADRKRILGQVRREGGYEDLNVRVRTAVYNNWRIMQIPAVQDAVYGYRERVAAFLRGYDRSTYAGDPGGSLLHDLVHGNFVDAAALVVELGADVNAQTDKGNTALHFAAEGDRGALLQLLLDSGAALDLQNAKGETPIMLAARDGRVRAVHALLRAGADASKTNRGGATAAELAQRGAKSNAGCALAVRLLAGEAVDVEKVLARQGEQSGGGCAIA